MTQLIWQAPPNLHRDLLPTSLLTFYSTSEHPPNRHHLQNARKKYQTRGEYRHLLEMPSSLPPEKVATQNVTVFVKGVIMRLNRGQSTKADRRYQKIQRFSIDFYEMNSGKGVIVDSGTTDTYLHKSIAAPFDEMWQRVTGKVTLMHL